MGRLVLTWALIFAGLVAAFVGTVVVLNATLYSASGFTRSYLDALSRKDAAGALELAGVTARGTDALLTSDALGTLDDVRVTADVPRADGVHEVTVSYRAGGERGESSFQVRPAGARLGLFTVWRFAVAPVATLAVTPVHDASFTANGADVTGVADRADGYRVLVPSGVMLTHRSEWLTATPSTVLVSAPGSEVDASVEARASDRFVQTVQQEVDAFLTTCTTQTVLLPAGCPFGIDIDDRVQGTPTWSMRAFPTVVIVPGATPGTWSALDEAGVAHVQVSVQSLYDGTIETRDENVAFRVGYDIAMQSDGSLRIEERAAS